MLAKCLILWIGYFVASTKAGVVPWIKPCAPIDSACIIKSSEFALPYVAKGVEELGIAAIDPMSIKDTIADSGEFKVKYRNVKLHNLSKCKFESFTRDPVKSTASVTTLCPTVIKGDYSMNGTIFLLNVFGDGAFSIEGGTMRTISDMKMKTFTKEGKKHYKVGSFHYKFEPVTKYKLEFENLLGGDKEKAEPVKKVMDEAWKELITDLGQSIMKEAMTTVAGTIDKVFKGIAAEELEIV